MLQQHFYIQQTKFPFFPMECSAIAAATAAITSLRHRFGHKFMVLLPFPFKIPFAVFVGIISPGDRRIASTHTHPFLVVPLNCVCTFSYAS